MDSIETARNIALSLLDPQTTPDEVGIRNAATLAVQALGITRKDVEINLNDLVRLLEANLNVFVPNASTLVDNSADHIPWLPDRRGTIEWNFTRRYQRLLRENKGWARQTLQKADSLTDSILELLEDPTRAGSWDRRGMVVGEVQSGKTSSYLELSCKAADAGYKFIVILTGGTNSLRAQTQLRFDEGFLGWDSRLDLDINDGRLGVGRLPGEVLHNVMTPTTARESGDFGRTMAKQFNVMLGGDPILMVVKKNASVLRNIISWAKYMSLGDDEDGKIPGVPILVIDDEADYASVNTRPIDPGGDEDPTVINQMIRRLLNTFEQKAFVAYTATPFANIFIYPEGDSPEFGPDLFPKDFLINLPVPSNHVGPTRVFGLRRDLMADIEEVEPLPLVRTVGDHETLIPMNHKSSWVIEELPESLKSAMKAFLLACAARGRQG